MIPLADTFGAIEELRLCHIHPFLGAVLSPNCKEFSMCEISLGFELCNKLSVLGSNLYGALPVDSAIGEQMRSCGRNAHIVYYIQYIEVGPVGKAGPLNALFLLQALIQQQFDLILQVDIFLSLPRWRRPALCS